MSKVSLKVDLHYPFEGTLFAVLIKSSHVSTQWVNFGERRNTNRLYFNWKQESASTATHQSGEYRSKQGKTI